jgi:hypothetical protein
MSVGNYGTISPPSTSTINSVPNNMGLPIIGQNLHPLTTPGGIGAGNATSVVFGANPPMYSTVASPPMQSQTASAASGTVPNGTGAAQVSLPLLGIVVVAIALLLLV